MDRLIDNSEKVQREIESRLIAGLNSANEFLIQEAKAGAPVKSGDLRDGIQVIREATQTNPTAVGASTMPYSAVVNRGDSRRAAKPFWSAAIIRMKAQLKEFFR